MLAFLYVLYICVLSKNLLPAYAYIGSEYSVPSIEMEALSKFFFNTNGPNWDNTKGWESLMSDEGPTDPCGTGLESWHGVECSDHHITSINLPDNSLTATRLPSIYLTNLSKLETFDVSNVFKYSNTFYGSNISDICLLSKTVTSIILSLTFISGPFPACVGEKFSDNLQTLDMAFTNITGTTPHSICFMKSLQVLNVNGNRLTGTLPSCIGDINSLQQLSYISETINGDVPGDMSISGSIPDSVCELQSLTELQLPGNFLTGTIPTCLGKNQSLLSIIEIEENLLTGSIPESLCNAKQLIRLQLNSNAYVHGSLPECLGRLDQLEYLLFGNNFLSSSIPDTFCNLKKIIYFELESNDLSGSIPDCIGNLSSTFIFDISVNSLTGSIPTSICDLKRSEYINFGDNLLTGTLPTCFNRLSSLSFLAGYVNSLTGVIPSQLCEINPLVCIDFYDNSLTGSIPDCLGQLPSFEWLVLDKNTMTGTVPESICNCSEFNILNIYSNQFTGSLPDCLGSLTDLQYVMVDSNHFTGTLSSSYCNLVELEYMSFFQNNFHGSIPPCYGYSFPHLRLMLLDNNHFEGELPTSWNLPSLETLILSNNKGLSGYLIPSLFHQQGEESVSNSSSSVASSSLQYNPTLRYVVIEGTKLKGSIPSAVSLASQLDTLLLSGNSLTGTLPSSITELQFLSLFRAPRNNLHGNIMKNINNMSSLTRLDLSHNHFSGTVPGALGDMSHQLEETNLILNHLSCDLPKSVLEWKKAPNFNSMDILDGNLFSCPQKGIFGLSMVTSKSRGLVDANRQSAEFYSCGGSAYLLPIVLPVCFALMMLISCAVCYYKESGIFSKFNRPLLFLNDRLNTDAQLSKAYLEMKIFSNSIVVIGLVSVFIMLPVVSSTVSFYSCQYAAKVTVGGKRAQHTNVSIAVGVSVGLSILVGSYIWWRRLVFKPMKNIPTDDSGDDVDDMDEDDEISQGDAARYNSNSSFSEVFELDPLKKTLLDLNNPYSNVVDRSHRDSDISDSHDSFVLSPRNVTRGKGYSASLMKSFSFRMIHLAALMVFLVLIVIGPNVVYLLIIVGNYSYDIKILCTLAIAFVKVSLTAVTIPKVSETVAVLLYPTSTSGFRFRLSVNIGVFFTGISLIFAPIVTVALKDKRCLNYMIGPENEVSNEVFYETCDESATNGECLSYTTGYAFSEYKPQFVYDGDQCVAAILSTYAPVFLAFILLSAPLSAFIDLLLVPLLAPWCYRNKEIKSTARWCLTFLKSMSWNVPCVLTANFSSQIDIIDITQSINLDYFARSVTRRAYVQFSATLLIALTFGLAAPVIGLACIIASILQFRHHTLILSQIVQLGDFMVVATVPNMKRCSLVPNFTFVTILITTLAFWCCVMIDYMNELVVVASFIVVIAGFLVGCVGYRVMRTSLSTPMIGYGSRESDDGQNSLNSSNMNNTLFSTSASEQQIQGNVD